MKTPLPKKILIVDDEEAMRMALVDSLTTSGYHVKAAANGEEALELFQKDTYAVVVSDIRMPKMSGLDVLKRIKKISPQTPVILITAYGTVKTAVEAMKEGATEFLMKPFSLDELDFTINNVLASRSLDDDGQTGSTTEESRHHQRDIITRDERMLQILNRLRVVAKSKATVLIQGESGTGKELVARYIYLHSERRNKPFIAVNCAAIPHNLLESEMFGFEKGAFTGAVQRKLGKFEMADGGTLLLDEVSEMDIQLQAKLLRVLQEGEVDRIGGKTPVPVDVRVIATTNVDLKAAIEEKKFRRDLFFRLNVIPVVIPPLRERKTDIPLLAEYFVKKFALALGKEEAAISREALDLLKAHDWLGNVRELENVMERAVLICDGPVIKADHLCMEGVFLSVLEEESRPPATPSQRENITLREMEKALIIETLNKVQGNRTKASQILGISVRTMRNKLHEYKLDDI